jgi:hypothetical protein
MFQQFVPSTLMLLSAMVLGLSALPMGRTAAMAADAPELLEMEPTCISITVSAKRADLPDHENFYAALAEACRPAMYRSIEKDDPAATYATSFLQRLEEFQAVINALSKERMLEILAGRSRSGPVNDVTAYLIAHEVGLFDAYAYFLRAEEKYHG